MQNMARGVGLSGLAAFMFECAMAAPAAAVQVPRTQVQLNVHIARPNPLPGGRIKTFKPNATPGINTVKGSLVHTQKGLQQNKKLQQKYIPNTPTGGGAASVGGIDVTKQVDPTNTSNPSGGTLEGSGGTLELGGGTTGRGGILKEGDLTSPNAVKGTGTSNINQGDPDRPVNIGSEYNGGGTAIGGGGTANLKQFDSSSPKILNETEHDNTIGGSSSGGSKEFDRSSAKVLNETQAGYTVTTGGGSSSGGSTGTGNVISGTSVSGVSIGTGTGNVISGNSVSGVSVGTGNVISGNSVSGVSIGTGNVISGNSVSGVSIGTGDGNVISGNSVSGVSIGTGTGNVISGGVGVPIGGPSSGGSQGLQGVLIGGGVKQFDNSSPKFLNETEPGKPVGGGGVYGGGIFNSNQATGGTGEGGGIFNSNQATGGSGGLNSGVPLSVGGGGNNPGGGMFETNLRDERFLPFEDAGAIGTWTLTLPSKHSAFDYSTISDVILHIHSTERSSTSSLPGQGIGSGGIGGQGGSLFPTAGNAITRYRNGAQYPMPR